MSLESGPRPEKTAQEHLLISAAGSFKGNHDGGGGDGELIILSFSIDNCIL